jgi:hypothetical protein
MVLNVLPLNFPTSLLNLGLTYHFWIWIISISFGLGSDTFIWIQYISWISFEHSDLNLDMINLICYGYDLSHLNLDRIYLIWTWIWCIPFELGYDLSHLDMDMFYFIWIWISYLFWSWIWFIKFKYGFVRLISFI